MIITNRVVNSAIDYIVTNLNYDLTVEEVAKQCNFSKFYFNRLFKAKTGESVYSFIKRLRIDKSAFRLGTDKNRTITEIGQDIGYSSSNYSSVFKKHHKLSPKMFRNLKKNNEFDLKHPLYEMEITYQDFEYYNDRIIIQVIQSFSVLYNRYIGNYKDMAIHWPNFINYNKHQINNNTKFIEVSYDDPNITDINRCIYDICITIEADNNSKNKKVINGGKFAIYKFKGSIEEIFQAFKGIFNIWVPESEYELDERIGFNIYDNLNSNINHFEIDFYIPLK